MCIKTTGSVMGHAIFLRDPLRQDSCMSESLSDLTRRLIAFRDARDWKTFHSAKNLMLSVALEAAEVLEIAQWKTDAELESALQEPAVKERLREECADVLLYLLLLAERADFDLLKAASDKMDANASKYPVEKSKGNAKKWTEL